MSKEFPFLYLRGAKGELRQWHVRTDGAKVITSYGIKDKKQTGDWYTAKAKNLGRANQTNAITQAEAEAASLFQKKLDEGYDPDPAVALVKEVFLPMLAKRADKVLKTGKLKWPCWGQRKYNGMRCMARLVTGAKGVKHVELFSRLGEVLNVPHIAADLLALGDAGDVFDGEFYIHGVPLQSIVSLVKDNRPESQALQYYIYDMPKSRGDVTAPWEDRWREVQSRMVKAVMNLGGAVPATGVVPFGSIAVASSLCLAETVLFNGPDDLDKFEKQAIGDGFEGVMLRPKGGKYKLNVRSSDLLKVKRYKDGEFEIVDVKSRYEPKVGADIVDCFVMKNDQSDATFKAVPIGTFISRQDMWVNRDTFIGKNATIRYFERSVDLIPIGNPTWRGIRDPLDAANKGEDDDDDKMWTNDAE